MSKFYCFPFKFFQVILVVDSSLKHGRIAYLHNTNKAASPVESYIALTPSLLQTTKKCQISQHCVTYNLKLLILCHRITRRGSGELVGQKSGFTKQKQLFLWAFWRQNAATPSDGSTSPVSCPDKQALLPPSKISAWGPCPSSTQQNTSLISHFSSIQGVWASQTIYFMF